MHKGHIAGHFVITVMLAVVILPYNSLARNISRCTGKVKIQDSVFYVCCPKEILKIWIEN